MKKQTVLILFMTMIMAAACGNTKTETQVSETKSIATTSEDEISDDTESNDVNEQDDIVEQNVSDDAEIEAVPDENALQQLYAKAYEYEYMAVGYYRDSDDPTAVWDGYVPFDEDYIQESTEYLKSSAHGVSIRVYMVKANNATDANAECTRIYKEQLEERGIDAEFYDAQSFDNDTLALGLCIYQNEKDEAVSTFLYSDVRGYGDIYMCAEIEFNEAEFDDTTPALVNEIDDVYGMTFSTMFQ